MSSKRLFIVDPVCAQGIGHNLASLCSYRGYISSLNLFERVEAIASMQLPELLGQVNDVRRIFSFNYWGALTLHDLNGNRLSASSDANTNARERSRIEFMKFFADYQLGENDTVFFPSADYYGALGALSAQAAFPPKKAPRILLRFIDVLENFAFDDAQPDRTLYAAITHAISAGYTVRLSVESPLYAEHIAMQVGLPVDVTPVPPFQQSLPLSKDTPFTVIPPGSARLDKGFNILPDIIAHYRIHFPHDQVRFLLQSLPLHETDANIRTVNTLYAMPGVDLLPSLINADQMEAMFARAHLAILPYDNRTYARRSSAVLAESIAYGRPIITSAGTGFESIVRYYGVGAICRTVEDYSAEIHEFYRMGTDMLAKKCLQVRHRFLSDCTSSYKGWMS